MLQCQFEIDFTKSECKIAINEFSSLSTGECDYWVPTAAQFDPVTTSVLKDCCHFDLCVCVCVCEFSFFF